MTRHNNYHQEENGASQEEPTHQQNINDGRRQQALNADHTPTVSTLNQHYEGASEGIQGMADRTEEQMFAIASRFYKAKHTAHGLKQLHVEVNEIHADAKIANEWTEARVAGTNVHSDVANFNMATENILQGQLRSLLQATGDLCIGEAEKSPYPPRQPKQEKKGLFGGLGLFGWKSKEKIVIERVPMDRQGSLVPDEILFED